MKRFVKHIILFVLPIIIGWGLLMQQSLDKKRAFHYLSDDCEGRGAWMYKRIFESKEPIDIAFLGSSHTINGINDTLINQTLFKAGINKKVTNMGYCRFGRDLTYVLMKMLIEKKRTNTFVIEVLENEEANTHPVFAYLAESKYILNPQTITNKSYFSNIYNGSVAKWMYMRQNVFSEPYSYKYSLTNHFGFTTNSFEADTTLLIKEQKKRSIRKGKSRTQKLFDTPYPQTWLNKIEELANKNGCNIYFLYLPPFGVTEKTPNQMSLYNQIGTVWTLPDTLLSNKSNWYDQDHMNLKGANTASIIVAEKIRGKQ